MVLVTLERIKNDISFHCDLKGCDEGLETGEDDFAEAKDVAKEAGWQFRKREDGWKHFCSRIHEEMDFRGQSLVEKNQ